MRIILKNQFGFTTQLRFPNRHADEDAHDYMILLVFNQCLLDTNKQLNLSEITAILR